MRDSRRDARPIVLAAALALLATSASAQFLCDVLPWDGTAETGFGAGVDEVRGFGVTPQNVPRECMVFGYSYFNGVIADVTRQGGASTMPVDFVEIRESDIDGPPAEIIVFGPGADVENVPQFPMTRRARFPTPPGVALLDFDNDGGLDFYLAPTVYADGNATPGQFFAASTDGPTVPCHTGLLGEPIDEPCVNGNPSFRSMGVGVETAAGLAQVRGLGPPTLDVRTNNPAEAADDTFRYLWNYGGDFSTPSVVDVIRIFDGVGQLICQDGATPPGFERTCVLTAEQIQQFLDGDLEVELQFSNDIGRDGIIPANLIIFTDGFESGDTSRWSNTIP